MEKILLISHSVLRYGVLLFGLYAITKCVLGIVKKQEYSKSHNLSATLFIAFVHLQVVIGFAQYFLKGWYKNIEMSNSVSRFFGIEHMLGMLVAAILIQMGRSKSKKQFEHLRKHRTALVYFTLGFLIILAMMPWPFREVGIARDWLPPF